MNINDIYDLLVVELGASAVTLSETKKPEFLNREISVDMGGDGTVVVDYTKNGSDPCELAIVFHYIVEDERISEEFGNRLYNRNLRIPLVLRELADRIMTIMLATV